MNIANILQRQNNNFDLFRLIAAFSVIYGHSMGIMHTANMSDAFYKVFKHEYTAAVAVNSFFFLSGLMVTNSLLSHGSVRHYLISRIFRIFPALIVVVMISAIFIGPIFSSIDLQDYFSNTETYRYIKKNIFLRHQPYLPGVFGNPHKYADVNIPLWTIRYEFFAYIFLLCAFSLGILKNRLVATIFGVLIILDGLYGNKFIFTSVNNSEYSLRFLSCAFAMGSLCAIWKNETVIDKQLFIFSWVFYYLLKENPYNYFFFHVAFFITILFIFSRGPALKFKLGGDISYGVYLWGWPVQQMLISIYPEQGSIFNCLLAIPISAIIAIFSWRLIEKPSIELGKNILDKLNFKSREKTSKDRWQEEGVAIGPS